jgi:molybdopterin converting factor small subunit
MSVTSAAPRVRVSVLLFARYAELLGTSSMSLELASPATIASVLAELRNTAGGKRLPAWPLVALNRQHAGLDAKLQDGDEVAVLPPLAGG